MLSKFTPRLLAGTAAAVLLAPAYFGHAFAGGSGGGGPHQMGHTTPGCAVGPRGREERSPVSARPN